MRTARSRHANSSFCFYPSFSFFGQTKELASRYERSLQESGAVAEKAKVRFNLTAEELERVLVQKEGENYKETGVQARSPGGAAAGGKRALGKAVVKGRLLLKGKNPVSVSVASFSSVFA